MLRLFSRYQVTNSMIKPVLSIRHKVITAFMLLFLFMTASILGSYYFMQQLEEKITYLEDVSKFEESVLETRRFEKNYFLYGDSKALTTALYHISRIRELLDKNYSKIEALSSISATSKFASDLLLYQQGIESCSSDLDNSCYANPQLRSQFESDLRKTGSALGEFARAVAQNKRRSIRDTMHATVRLQLVAFVIVGFGIIAVGSFVFIKVMRPLHLLEESTKRIAVGNFQPIENNLPPEKEIHDIFDSFNKMAEQLKIREEQLVQSKKLASLGTMLAGVAHEVNNPLSNISSSCEIILEEIDSPDKEWHKKLLEKVLEQVDKARSIVSNLLEFSRNTEFCKESINLTEVIQKSLGLLQGHIPADVSIKTHLDPDLVLCADKQRIQQAILNLLSNAVQAIPGTGTVTVSSRLNQNGMATIRIQDTGEGIAKEDLSKIFDPFFTTKDVGQGTGLGLFITHDIIIRHNGTIDVQSSPGAGTIFEIRLPITEPLQCTIPQSCLS
jgi:two-component system, NtrC family, sensor kinase